jgi:signal transduction histidine kinase
MTDDAPAHRARGGVEAWAGLAAHQLGGALALVRGAARVLDASRDRLAPDGQDALAALAAGAERAQRFVDDLVDLVRSGDEPHGTPSTDLDRALDAAADQLADALRDAGTTLRRAPLPPAPLERAEAERLFVHLLRSAAAAGAREIRVAGAAEAGATRVEVLDDGSVPASAAALEGSDPRGRGPLVGAGVSLLVARNIVERRGGTLEVEQGEGGSTAVRLSLPRGG